MQSFSQSFFASSPLELQQERLFIRLDDLAPAPVHLKLEGYNPAGSIKLKPALGMIAALEEEGRLRPGCEIIESSSGNLGVALAIVCAERGYRFTCVTDPVSSEANRSLIRAYGGRVIVVAERDENGGFLQTRLRLIRAMLAENQNLIWLNQYANPRNPGAHAETTAPEILASFPVPDWLFVGAGTTGTLVGCLQHFRVHSPRTRIVAVDAEGSVTFGGAPALRRIPGLGSSRRPEIAGLEDPHAVAIVPEADTLRMCHRYARGGLLLGGSTGTTLAGLARLADRIAPDATVVAISPDFGERYLRTIYDPEWIRMHFGDDLHDELYGDAPPELPLQPASDLSHTSAAAGAGAQR